MIYDPNNPVEIHTAPGASLRLEFGADEEIVQVITSDQDILAPDPTAPPLPAVQASTGLPSGQGGQANQLPPSCDVTCVRSVWGNIVYIKPIRPLDPQPLFVQTRRTGINGKPEMVPYAFELSAARRTRTTKTRRSGASGSAIRSASRRSRSRPGSTGSTGMRPTRKTGIPRAAGKRGAKPERQFPLRLSRRRRTAPGRGLGRWPDHGPAVQRQSPCPEYLCAIAGREGNPLGQFQRTDATGNTLKIAGTGQKWFLRDGDEAGCLFDLGPDPNGRTATTIAAPQGGGR